MGKQFTAQTFRWLHQLNCDKRLLAIDLCVCVELTKYFNESDQGGRAWPGAKTVGDAIGLHEVTVLRAVRRVETAGYLRIIWGRRGSGHSNQYWMIVKPAAEQVSKPAARSSKKPAARSEKPAATQVNLLKEPAPSTGGAKAPPSVGDGERALVASQPISSIERAGAPDGAARSVSDEPAEPPRATEPSKQAASPQDRPWEEEEPSPEKVQFEPEAKSPPREEIERAPPSQNKNGGDAAMTTTWRAILARYRRGWAGDDDPKQIAIARAAYAKLIANGVAPADILAGISKWIEMADAPRFLPPLMQLLTTRAFEQPPPLRKAKRKRANGGAVANSGGKKTLPRTNGNKVDVTKVALMQGGYVEDENGNLYHPDGNASSGLFWLRGATP